MPPSTGFKSVASQIACGVVVVVVTFVVDVVVVVVVVSTASLAAGALDLVHRGLECALPCTFHE